MKHWKQIKFIEFKFNVHHAVSSAESTLGPSVEVTKIQQILVQSIFKTIDQDSLETQRGKSGHLAATAALQIDTEIPERVMERDKHCSHPFMQQSWT